jgi:hypothetical protein
MEYIDRETVNLKQRLQSATDDPNLVLNKAADALNQLLSITAPAADKSKKKTHNPHPPPPHKKKKKPTLPWPNCRWPYSPLVIRGLRLSHRIRLCRDTTTACQRGMIQSTCTLRLEESCSNRSSTEETMEKDTADPMSTSSMTRSSSPSPTFPWTTS